MGVVQVTAHRSQPRRPKSILGRAFPRGYGVHGLRCTCRCTTQYRPRTERTKDLRTRRWAPRDRGRNERRDRVHGRFRRNDGLLRQRRRRTDSRTDGVGIRRYRDRRCFAAPQTASRGTDETCRVAAANRDAARASPTASRWPRRRDPSATPSLRRPPIRGTARPGGPSCPCPRTQPAHRPSRRSAWRCPGSCRVDPCPRG